MKSLLLSFFLLAGFSVNAAEIGKAAPDFKLKDHTGKEYSLSEFKGKNVVLEWYNHDCPFVRKHYDSGNMQKLQKEYSGEDTVWLTIISSAPGEQGHRDPAGIKKERDAEKMASLTTLIDESGVVGRSYDAKTTPHMYIVDASGVLRYQGAIDSIRSADKNDITKAENYVASAMAAIKKGESVKVAKTNAYGCGVKYKN
jgi:peroxiredoxin